MIRPARPGEAGILRDVFARSITGIGARFYGPEQVQAWLANAPSADRLDECGRDGRLRLVAVDERDVPQAFVDLEPNGHVDFLYCAPEAAGRGVGAALLDEIEREAKRAAMARLYAEASEAALPLFKKKGFGVIERRDFAVLGVPIHNYAVEKDLLA